VDIEVLPPEVQQEGLAAFRKQTRQHEDAQQRLAANVFRAITLADHASPV
jgi:hypothetical protein